MESSFERNRIAIGVRWLKFNFVGVIGTLVQLVMLAICTYWTKLSYVPAVILAVECTILHNFFWHERFTWRDRECGTGWERAGRLLRFNATNGGISLIGNIFLMRLLVGQFHLPILVANGIAILACSIANFMVGDRFVFRRSPLWAW